MARTVNLLPNLGVVCSYVGIALAPSLLLSLTMYRNGHLYDELEVLALPQIAVLLYVAAYVGFLSMPRLDGAGPITVTTLLAALFTSVVLTADTKEPLAIPQWSRSINGLVSLAAVALAVFVHFYSIAHNNCRYTESRLRRDDITMRTFNWFVPYQPTLTTMSMWTLYVSTASIFLCNYNAISVLCFLLALEVRYALRTGALISRVRPVALSPYDTSILRAQVAKAVRGELSATAGDSVTYDDLMTYKRNGEIHELIVTPGNIAEGKGAQPSLYWRPCDRESRACFMLKYVMIYGLNTPPCCKAHMYTIIEDISQVLTKLGITHWLEGGTLLGPIRSNGGRILPWEDDVDVSFYIEDDPDFTVLLDAQPHHGGKLAEYGVTRIHPLILKLQSLVQARGYTMTVTHRGYIHIFYMRPPMWPFTDELLRMEVCRRVRLDLVQYREKIYEGQPRLYRPQKGVSSLTQAGIPRNVILPVQSVRYTIPDPLTNRPRHVKFPLPRKPDEYLTMLYGDYNHVSYQYLKQPGTAQVREAVDPQWLPTADLLPCGNNNDKNDTSAKATSIANDSNTSQATGTEGTRRRGAKGNKE